VRAFLTKTFASAHSLFAAFFGFAVGIALGLIWAYWMMLGPNWWKPFYHWQSLTAGAFALIAALTAYLGVRQQVTAMRAVEEENRNHEKHRELADKLYELGVLSFKMFNEHRAVRAARKSYDEDLLMQDFTRLVMFPVRLDDLVEFDELVQLRSVLADYGNAGFHEEKRVNILTSDKGTLSIINFLIPWVISKWASDKMRVMGCTVNGTVERAETAEWRDPEGNLIPKNGQAEVVS